MPVSSAISCCQQLRPPAAAAPREEGSSSSSRIPLSRRRACFVAAACVAVATGGAGEAAAAAMAMAPPHEHEAAALVRVQAPSAKWSERRQCPPWRANSLENVVPENLPRPSARRRYNGVGTAAGERDPAPAPAGSPEAVLPFLALRSGGMGCFSL